MLWAFPKNRSVLSKDGFWLAKVLTVVAGGNIVSQHATKADYWIHKLGDVPVYAMERVLLCGF